MKRFDADEDHWRSIWGLDLAGDGLVLIASLDIMFKIFTNIRKPNNAKLSSKVRCSPWLANYIVEVLTDK